jgi:hypothetical protein
MHYGDDGQVLGANKTLFSKSVIDVNSDDNFGAF